MYRAHQVHHKMANEAAGAMLPVIIPTGEVILITTTFSVIRFHDTLSPFIMGLFSFVGVLTV